MDPEEILSSTERLYALQRRILLVGPDRLEVQREEGMQTLRAAGKWLLLERRWIPMHAARPLGRSGVRGRYIYTRLTDADRDSTSHRPVRPQREAGPVILHRTDP